MIIEPLAIDGAFQIGIEPIADDRGFFARTFCKEIFASHGLTTDFAQRSISYSKQRGTLRGLHYQARPHAETKIVCCTRGAVFDVIVDLRPHSPSFKRWQGIELTAENRLLIYIPAGCAHGLQTLMDDSELIYEITPAYIPTAARGIAWDDPALGISWPFEQPILSPADRGRPRLSELTKADAAVI